MNLLKWRLIVALVFCSSMTPSLGSASDAVAQEAAKRLESDWSNVFYLLPEDQQGSKLEGLLSQAEELIKRYPHSAEPLLVKALILCALAGNEGGVAALDYVKEAKSVLHQSLSLDPWAMEGTGYVTLGNLYYRLPGWPVSFGEDAMAEKYLKLALKHFPEAMDTNYFYGDFLLEQGDFTPALIYLEKADKAPVRESSRLADLRLKKELVLALKDAREQTSNRPNFFSRFLSGFSGDATD